MCEKCFPIVFLWRWISKDSFVLKLERCKHKDGTSIVDTDQEGVKCQLSSVLIDLSKESVPLGLSEQHKHTLAKIQVRVFFNGTSTIKSLCMHPKDPIPDAQTTDIIHYWKYPAHNCTAEYTGETNRSLKERDLDHRIQTTSAIRNCHLPTKHPKGELKNFTIVDRDSNTLHHWAKEGLYICIKNPSLNRNIGKVRIPSLFNTLLKPHTQLKQHPPPKEGTFITWSSNTKDNWHFTPSWCLSTIEVPSLCLHLSSFKTTESLDLHLQRNTIQKHFSHITTCHFLQKYLSFKFSVS